MKERVIKGAIASGMEVKIFNSSLFSHKTITKISTSPKASTARLGNDLLKFYF